MANSPETGRTAHMRARGRRGGCSCHGETFCPDLVCLGYDDDVPVYVHKDSQEARDARERKDSALPRVESPDLHANFQSLCPSAPLPWSTHRFNKWLIVDANGDEVCLVDGSADDRDRLVAMILVAVNTCGGFRAETQTGATS